MNSRVKEILLAVNRGLMTLCPGYLLPSFFDILIMKPEYLLLKCLCRIPGRLMNPSVVCSL